MNIEIFGQLLPGQPRKQVKDLSAPETARKVAESIGLDPEEIGLITINGVQSRLEDRIESDDTRLCFFPYITGG